MILAYLRPVAARGYVKRERSVSSQSLLFQVDFDLRLYLAFDDLRVLFVSGFCRSVKATTVDPEVIAVEWAFGAFVGHLGTALSFWF